MNKLPILPMNQSPIHQFYNPPCLLSSVFCLLSSAFCPLSSVFCPLHLSRTLYKSALFMQNKPNFSDAQMNVNKVLTKDYERNDIFAVQKNKPNSKPISEKPKMNVNLYVIEDYENIPPSGPKKTNPIKPNFSLAQIPQTNPPDSLGSRRRHGKLPHQNIYFCVKSPV